MPEELTQELALECLRAKRPIEVRIAVGKGPFAGDTWVHVLAVEYQYNALHVLTVYGWRIASKVQDWRIGQEND